MVPFCEDGFFADTFCRIDENLDDCSHLNSDEGNFLITYFRDIDALS